MTSENIRSLFPELKQTVYGKPLVYLDNAATSQRPLQVIEKWNEMSSKLNSNLHRAVHHIADLATEEFESTRAAVATFIGAPSPKNIVFTSGATHSLNLVAFSFGEAFVHEDDEIIVCESEHHSNIVPWQMMAARKKARITVLPVEDDGTVDPAGLKALINPKTRLVCIAHISNVLGIEKPVKEIVNICHSNSCPILIDGAQGIVHSSVNVTDLDCDFYLFSGHKIYAAPGTGVLYAKDKWLESMPPYMGGGEMIGTVTWGNTTYAPWPHKFEAGTQNIAGIPTLKPALALAKEFDCPEIKDNQRAIIEYVLDEFKARKNITLYGNPSDRNLKVPVFSISVEGAHHEDLALILDKMGIAVRSGQMCAEPLMDRFGVTGMLRASFAPYNTLEEAEYFIKSLDRAVKMLG